MYKNKPYTVFYQLVYGRDDGAVGSGRNDPVRLVFDHF